MQVAAPLYNRTPSADPIQGKVTLLWQKDIFEIERQGDTLTIIDVFKDNAQPVTWKLGDMVSGGGGMTGSQGGDYHAKAGFSERYPGPYFLASGFLADSW